MNNPTQPNPNNMSVTMSGSIANLAAAFVAVSPRLKNPPFDEKNPHFGNSYASLESHLSVNRETLAEAGLAVSQFLESPAPGLVGVRTMLLHKSGEFISTSVALAPAKPDGQTAASLTTYLRRYSYAACLGIVGSEDDDAEADRTSREPESRPSRAPAQASSSPRPSPAKSSSPATSDRDILVEFGKHTGKTLGQIVDEDRGWVEWVLSKEPKLAPDGKPYKKDVILRGAMKRLLDGGSPAVEVAADAPVDDVPF